MVCLLLILGDRYYYYHHFSDKINVLGGCTTTQGHIYDKWQIHDSLGSDIYAPKHQANRVQITNFLSFSAFFYNMGI